MKVAILTGHKYNKIAIALAKELKKSNIDFFVMICTDYKSLLKGLINKIKQKNLKKYIRESTGESLTALSNEVKFKVYFSNDVNSAHTHNILRSEKTDIAIQAGVGIIKKQVLRIPKIGILNAHMALLPKYRGMNVLEWSLFYGDPVGMSIHFIDEGIDTGDILLQEAINIEKGDTIERLRQKADRLFTGLFIKAVKGLQEGSLKRVEQAEEDGRQYFVMHPRLKNYVENKLKG